MLVDMTVFLLARLHRYRLRQLVAGEGLPPDLVPEPLIIACPRCDAEYFADLEPTAGEPLMLEPDEWEAVSRLEDECPNHAHRFHVGEG